MCMQSKVKNLAMLSRSLAQECYKVHCFYTGMIFESLKTVPSKVQNIYVLILYDFLNYCSADACIICQ